MLTSGNDILCRQPVSPQTKLLTAPVLISGAIGCESNFDPASCILRQQLESIIPG